MKTWVMGALVVLGACSQRKESSAPDSKPQPVVAAAPSDIADMKTTGGAGSKMALDEGKMGKKDSNRRMAEDSPAPPPPPEPEVAEKPAAQAAAGEEAPQSRSWFPETFLFEPLVVTDAQGSAKVSVRVPDRLTTWRVLALAHARDGAQAGAVTSFLGTLPAYVDPIVPPFLLVGDEIRLPVQMVNTGEAPIVAELRLAAEGATLSAVPSKVTVPAGGSLVQTATLRAGRPGAVTLKASLGATDAVVRTFPVLPAGKRVVVSTSGTLAAPRVPKLAGPAAADPASAEARLTVYPGALGLLRTELAGSRLRGGVAEDAYTLLLAGDAGKLLAAFGDKADPAAVRELTLVAAQRVIHHARTLDVVNAALLLPAALAHPDNAVLTRVGERAASHLASNQRPDGTFGGADGWTLQRLLVMTAEATRAVGSAATSDEGRRRAAGVRLKAEGAFERQLERVEDGYTAAAIAASGAVAGEMAEKLRVKVRAAVKASDDGARYLPVEPGVVRSDGSTPTVVEATAQAVLALAGSPLPADTMMLADMGTTILSAYDPGRGWGDGRANLVCMLAVLQLFKDPIPPGVKITLSVDGKQVGERTLDRDRIREVLTITAAAPVGAHEWRIESTPPVAGLAYALAVTGYVPWEKPAARGLELAIATPKEMQAGRPAVITMTAVAPSDQALHIHQALPAGVQVDKASLDKLVEEESIERWESADGTLDLYAGALEAGQTWKVAFRVIPTLGGLLHAPASTIEAGGESYDLPPAPWTIR